MLGWLRRTLTGEFQTADLQGANLSRNWSKVVVLAGRNDGLRAVLARMLERAGHQVIRVGRGGELLEKMLAGAHVDAIIADADLVDRSGFEALEALREFDETPVVLLADHRLLKRCAVIERLNATIIKKPVDWPWIERWLGDLTSGEATDTMRSPTATN